MRALKRLAIGGGVLLLTPLLLEVGFRLLEERLGVFPWMLANVRDYVCEGHLRAYKAHPYTVYCKPINSFGFNDKEWRVERTPGVPRILCLGGSTTESGNPRDQQGSYPHFLELMLEQRCGRDFEVYNAGISAWTTAEIVISWFLLLQDFQPDVLVIDSSINDVEPRLRSDMRADYSHWRSPMSTPDYPLVERVLTRWSDLYAWMVIKRGIPNIADLTTRKFTGPRAFASTGELDPATTAPFRRNVRTVGEHAQSHGARIILVTDPLRPEAEEDDDWIRAFRCGIAQHNQIMRDLAAEEGWLLSDAARLDDLDLDLRRSVFLDLVHVTPEGNQGKAEVLLNALLADWPAQLGERP